MINMEDIEEILSELKWGNITPEEARELIKNISPIHITDKLNK